MLITLLAMPLAAPMDVLMLAVDDLRPQLACFDVPGTVRPPMHTPNICNLAKDSLVLQRSQVSMATCSPSRTALLTGRHATSTHVWDLFSYFRDITGNFTTIPQYFKEQAGYSTYGMGKIFHPGHASGGGDCAVCRGSDDGDYSWSEPYFHGTSPVDTDGGHSWMAVPESVTQKTPLQDTQVAEHAVATLRNISKQRAREQSEGASATYTNFFLAVGFHKPHLPFVFPEKFLDYYPLSKVSLPENPYAPVDMPKIAWQTYGETRNYKDIAALNASGAINTTLPDDVVLSLRRAYYAAVSYTDSNIGVVLDSLETLGMANTTLITFWGDHGWQLGEHGEWDKHTNFDLATHAPLLFRSPGLTDGGVVTYQLAETVDIFPTLVDLALGRKIDRCPADSSKVLTCTEGTSLRALIASPQTPLKDAAFSVYSRGIPRTPPSSEVGTVEVDGQGPNGPAPSNCLDLEGKGRGCAMGYTMLTRIDGSLVRYTEWVHFPGPSNAWRPRWDTSYGTELYNHSVDPGENVNVYTSVRGTELASRLQARLHKGSEANGNA